MQNVVLRNMYSEVKKNPTRSIGEIYKEQRGELSKDLTEEERNQFFEMIPSQASVIANLTSYKSK